jgi:hypothetical protein
MNSYLNCFFTKRAGRKNQKEKNEVRRATPCLWENRFREMDGLKNSVGLEISSESMRLWDTIFSQRWSFLIDLAISGVVEIVPSAALATDVYGVSSFDQLLDFEHRGESNLDILFS